MEERVQEQEQELEQEEGLLRRSLVAASGERCHPEPRTCLYMDRSAS